MWNLLKPSGNLRKPPLTQRRKYAALAVAGAADLIQVAVFPLFLPGAASPWDVALDVLTTAVLILILGFRWPLVAALVAEAVPGLALFPTWTAFVLTFPVRDDPEEGVKQLSS